MGVLESLLKLSRSIDRFTTLIGRWVAWLIVVAIIISSGNAIIRKVFDASSNAYLEMQWMLFGAVFLICAPWTLLVGEHIKIDIVNHLLPLKVRSWIDLIGHVFFLLPFCVVLFSTSIQFFLASYHQNEQSFNAGGLPQWPAKSLIMIGLALLLVQAISETIKRVAVMQSLLPDPNANTLSAQEQAELEAERLMQVISSEKH